jgi:restriction system protein
MAAEHIKLGVVLASGEFTVDAVEFSKGKHVQLIDGSRFLKLILGLPQNIQDSLLEKITLGDYKTPSCPSCDIKLIKRTASKGKNVGSTFWGCKNFPECRYTLKNSML